MSRANYNNQTARVFWQAQCSSCVIRLSFSVCLFLLNMLFLVCLYVSWHSSLLFWVSLTLVGIHPNCESVGMKSDVLGIWGEANVIQERKEMIIFGGQVEGITASLYSKLTGWKSRASLFQLLYLSASRCVLSVRRATCSSPVILKL